MKRNKITKLVIAALFAVSPVVEASANVLPSTDVKAAEGEATYNNLVKAKIATPRAAKKGKLKFHFYKTVHKKTLWKNINIAVTGDIVGTSFPKLCGTETPILGYVTRGKSKTKNYIVYDTDYGAHLANKVDFERPTLKYSKQKLTTYTADSVSSFNEIFLYKNEKSKNFIIPTRHNAVSLLNENYDSEKFVPVISLDNKQEVTSCFLKKSDYDKLIKTPSGKHVKVTGGNYYYQKKGKAYYKLSKWDKYSIKQDFKEAKKELKTYKRSVESSIKGDIDDTLDQINNGFIVSLFDY